MFNNIHIWLADYLRQAPLRNKLKKAVKPVHIIFSVVDHFEPRVGGVSAAEELERTRRFLSKYESIASKHKDSTGVPPQYSFFYPIDEYNKECVDRVADLCRKGYGELEVHLHHKDDTEILLREKLVHAVDTFKSHGLLNTDKKTGETRYGFIHGNWSLCNSRPDGKWCGVNEELKILKETGCYADFTLPSAPSDTQTSKINSIYYAKNTARPRSHNTGEDVTVGKAPSGDLMIIQGPLMLDWQRKKIENAALIAGNPVTPERIKLWIEARVHVKGCSEWIFIKIHNHGCRPDHLTDDFFSNMNLMFFSLEKDFNDGKSFCLHYATAREMYNIIKAAEEGKQGDPSHYRDHVIVSNIKKSL
jgi:hypothetical protein